MTKAAERLRRSELAAAVVTVFIHTNRFSAGPQYSNADTTELAYSTDELIGYALKGLEKIYRAGYRYKKAGVFLNKLTPADQLSMRLAREQAIGEK